MTTASGLQEILNKRADAELESTVKKAVLELTKTLNRLCSNASASWVEVQFKVGDQTQRYSYDAIMKRVENAVITNLREKFRAAAVQAFMDKVESLQDQIDELQAYSNQ